MHYNENEDCLGELKNAIIHRSTTSVLTIQNKTLAPQIWLVMQLEKPLEFLGKELIGLMWYSLKGMCLE